MSYQRFLMFPLLELIFASTITYIFYEQGLSGNKESCISDPRVLAESTVETRHPLGLDRSQHPEE
jgi:hypothetical protein